MVFCYCCCGNVYIVFLLILTIFFQAFPVHMKETNRGSGNLFESNVTAQRNVVTLHECLQNRRTKLADGAGKEERKPPQKGPPPPLQPPPEASPPLNKSE